MVGSKEFREAIAEHKRKTKKHKHEVDVEIKIKDLSSKVKQDYSHHFTLGSFTGHYEPIGVFHEGWRSTDPSIPVQCSPVSKIATDQRDQRDQSSPIRDGIAT